MLGRPATLALASLLVLAALISCGDEADPRLDFIDLRAEEIADTTAMIRFETSRPTTCEVEYGFEIGTFDSVATDPSMTDENEYSVDHEVPLSQLQPSTTYYYRGRASDAAGRTYRSDPQTFTTAALIERPDSVAATSAGAIIVGVSSNFGGAANDGAWGAQAAFDGDAGSEWATNGDGDGAWVEIDLPEETAITGLGWRSRQMPDGSSIITAVRVVLDESTTLGPFPTPDPATFYHFDWTPMAATRVRFEAVSSSGGNTGAREIELYSD